MSFYLIKFTYIIKSSIIIISSSDLDTNFMCVLCIARTKMNANESQKYLHTYLRYIISDDGKSPLHLTKILQKITNNLILLVSKA